MQKLIVANQSVLCRESMCEFIRNDHHDIEIISVDDFYELLDHREAFYADLIIFDMNDEEIRSNLDLSKFDKDIIFITKNLNAKNLNKFGGSKVYGFIPDDYPVKYISNEIKNIINGERIKPNKNGFEGHHFSTKTNEKLKNLTQRERQVLSYLIKGHSNKQIAHSLSIEIVTVKLHVRGICKKLDVVNRTQAALYAKDQDWI